MTYAVEMEHVDFRYSPGADLLRGLTFGIEPGTFLAIAGPNGSGKTTVLRLLTGLLRPRAGQIRIEGKPLESYGIRALAEKVAVVSQEPEVPWGFSAAETVQTARIAGLGHRVFSDAKDLEVVQECLRLTDTSLLADRQLNRLSGGERQRVLIARALAQETPILLLDEPTAFLDLRHQLEIYDLLRTLRVHQGKTIVIITHDLGLAARYCDRVLLLRGGPGPVSPGEGGRGSFIFGRPLDVLTGSGIEDVFGVRVLTGRIADQWFFVPIKGQACDQGGGPRDFPLPAEGSDPDPRTQR